MTATAIQDAYPPTFSHCYGCGNANPHGHHLRSFLEGDVASARFTPEARYSGGVPEHVYGGMVASLLDCHGTASAAAFARRHHAQAQLMRFVTASLHVDFKRPTPLGVELLIEGRLRSLEGRKAWIDLTLSAAGEVCASGEMLAIQLKAE